MFKTLSIAAVLVGFAVTLSAQVSPYPDTFKVNYFANANTEGCLDGTLRITNVGTQTGSTTDPSGNLCALIYVFDASQELSECCGSKITPDGLLTLSVNNDLTSNQKTLTDVPLVTGDLKIVSSTSCNPTKPAPAAGVRAWMTHMQTFVPPFAFQTETESSDSNLSTGELDGLAARCAAIHLVGSGFGICTCGTSTAP
ncbi:MAG: hypothetical protein ABSG13_31150 [Bryobacteraceae bacterium]|jgi:hypothetical protein